MANGGDAEALFSKYEMLNELGRGAFSIVKLAKEKSTGKSVAVKIIEKKNVAPEYKKNLETETQILRKVAHPNIIQLLEMFETDEFLFLVMELVVGGELFDRIVEKGAYSELEAAELMRKIVEAIDYLHKMDICHRDLVCVKERKEISHVGKQKPENLLLATKESDVDVKISDFGLSKIISKKVMMQTACGTPGYVAPEVLAATGYDKEVDMWSVGVITYILLCGFPPFYGDSMPVLFEQILQGRYDYPEDYWRDVSQEAVDFIDRLLVVDKTKRMTSSEALAHPWLAKRNFPAAKLNISGNLKKHVALRSSSTAAFTASFDL